MTETPSAPARAWIKYDPPEDTGEVALPGYLNASPSYVRPGDVTSIDGAYLEEVTASSVVTGEDGEETEIPSRFVEVDEPREASENASLTRAQLAEKLNAGDPDASYTGQEAKADLVAAADEYDRTHPEPPSDPDGDQDNPEGDPS